MISEEPRLKGLMVEAQKGDAVAYRALLAALQAGLRTYFLRRVSGDAARADDLMQETLLAIHAKRATYDASQPLTAWVYAVARYKLADHWRRQGVRRTEPLEDAEALGAEDGAFEDVTARADVSRLLDGLPPQQADSIRLTKIEGLSVAEAAERIGASESAVKVNVHRGLKALMRRVAGQTGA